MPQDNPTSPDKEPSTGKPQASGLGKFWQELKRRHVVRVAVVYAVAAWLIIQIAVATFPSLYIPQWALSLVIMCVILGFPVSLILAWAFELTPEGVKTTKTARVDHPESDKDASHAKKRSWLAYAVGAAVPTVIFSVLALFFYIRSGGDAVVADDKSIAVLPFDNRSELKSDEFFTDGIHDDLLTQISRIRDIKTLSRTSVMAYKDTTKNMVTIGEELGVNWLLEGGVQRGGQQIRINVQLIDATNDAHLWAETYTRELTAENIFRIQSEIVTLIADSLKAVISPEEKERLEMLPTNNLEALEAYFRGMEGYVIRTTTSIENSIDHFEEAISLDPDFALAHLKLGASFIDQITHLGFSRDEGVAKAEPYVLKALELDDTLSEAYRVLGVLRRYQGDRAAAEIAHQKAIELDPNNPQAYDAYEILVRGKTGPTPRTADLMRKAYEADPKDSLAKGRLYCRA
jgi:TolB-like protein